MRTSVSRIFARYYCHYSHPPIVLCVSSNRDGVTWQTVAHHSLNVSGVRPPIKFLMKFQMKLRVVFYCSFLFTFKIKSHALTYCVMSLCELRTWNVQNTGQRRLALLWQRRRGNECRLFFSWFLRQELRLQRLWMRRAPALLSQNTWCLCASNALHATAGDPSAYRELNEMPSAERRRRTVTVRKAQAAIGDKISFDNK